VLKPFYIALCIVLIMVSNLGAQTFRLNIKGNSKDETKTIDSLDYKKRLKNYASIKSEIDTLRAFLSKMGYIENQLLEIQKQSDSIFNAKLHLKQKFNIIYIYFDKDEIDEKILKSIIETKNNDYFILKIAEVESKLKKLNTAFANQGYPFLRLKLSDIEKKNKIELKSNLIITKNNKRIINKIKIVGYEKFPKSFIKHFLKLKESETFSLSEIEKKTEQLNNLRFANQLKTPEVLFKKDTTTLYLYLNKTRSNTFDGFLGFGTNDQTNRLEFDGYLNLRLTNNLNYGETFSLFYKSDEIDQNTFDATLQLPYLFNSPLGVDLNLRIFRKDSSFTTVDQKVKINYQINALHKLSVGLSKIESSNLISENTINTLQNYNTNYISLSYEFLKPQFYDLLFPIKSNFYLNSNFGNRLSLGVKTNQSLITLKAFNNFILNRKNSIYLNVDAGNLISDNYFDNELLRFGGINSIRGFEENSIFASLFGVLNAEYRYRLSNSIYLHSITDFAFFENKISNTSENLFGFGFGFGIRTKSGLLRFNYANGKNESQKLKLSNSKIHLSLVTNF